jgi:hypothetical protein
MIRDTIQETAEIVESTDNIESLRISGVQEVINPSSI